MSWRTYIYTYLQSLTGTGLVKFEQEKTPRHVAASPSSGSFREEVAGISFSFGVSVVGGWVCGSYCKHAWLIIIKSGLLVAAVIVYPGVLDS